jgi:hypothetical protein
MKILLDENVPKLFKLSLKNHHVSSVKEQGWISIHNGELLRLMLTSGFEVLITLDKSLSFQQNFEKYPIPVIVLRAKKYDTEIVLRFVSEINLLLKRRVRPGAHELMLD